MRTLLDKQYYLIIFLGCICLSYTTEIAAQENIKVTLVKEFKLSETAKSTFLNFSNPQNPVPKVEVYDQKIIFYNNSGNIIETKSYNQPIYITPSRNEKYFQVSILTQLPTKNSNGESTLELYKDDGKLIWSKTVMKYEDYNLNYFTISDNGNSVEIRADAGEIIFYDKNGNWVNKYDEFKISNFDYLGAFRTVFSDDGEKLLLGITYPPKFNMSEQEKENRDRGIHRNRQSIRSHKYTDDEIQWQFAEILMFSNAGEVIWQFRSKNKRVFRLFISPDKQYVVFSGYDQSFDNQSFDNQITYILDAKTGELLSEHRGILAQYIKFFETSSKQSALINSLSQRVVTIKLIEGNLNNLYTTQGDEKILGTAVNVAGDLIIIAKSDKKLIPYKRGYKSSFYDTSLIFYNNEGSLIGEKSIPVEGIGYLDKKNLMKFIGNDSKLSIYYEKHKTLKIYEILVNSIDR